MSPDQQVLMMQIAALEAQAAAARALGIATGSLNTAANIMQTQPNIGIPTKGKPDLNSVKPTAAPVDINNLLATLLKLLANQNFTPATEKALKGLRTGNAA